MLFRHVIHFHARTGLLLSGTEMYIQEGGMLPPGVGGQQEARRRSPPAFDYLGYIRPRMRGSGEPEAKDQLLTVQFSWFGEVKDQSSSFIGVSPCFELALYTLVYLAGQEGKNLVQVSGTIKSGAARLACLLSRASFARHICEACASFGILPITRRTLRTHCTP